MAEYEYKVVAAPRKGKSYKGVRSHEDQFATCLAEVMNKMALEDWEYLRAESLPCEEKTGITSRVVAYQSVLVFRRKIKANQKFFEVPQEKRLEHHPVTEDRVEADAVFTSRHSNVTSIDSTRPDTQMQETPGSRSSILSILKDRRARKDYADGDDTRLAAE